MFENLKKQGFRVETLSHAEAILGGDFPAVEEELESILLKSQVPIEEIIGSGGGEAKGTQRLRRSLKATGWSKHKFTVQRVIDGMPLESRSHEIDHIKTFDAGTIALEIEWNNKDPFFDRDLENYKRLHADGAISVGIIVTRGPDLQDAMKALVRRFVEVKNIDSHDDMERIGLTRTPRQIKAVMKRVERKNHPLSFRDAWVDHFISDKFGAATTHWRKLEERVQRGVGNPCPLVLIGLPASLVTFGEDPDEVARLIEESETQQEDGTSESE
jgi:hypothetical protein